RKAELGRAIGSGPARRAFEKQDDLTAGRKARRPRNPGHVLADLASRKFDGEGLRDASADRLETRESDEREWPRLSPHGLEPRFLRDHGRTHDHRRATRQPEIRPGLIGRGGQREPVQSSEGGEDEPAGARKRRHGTSPFFWRRAYADRPEPSVEHRPAGLA